VLITDDEAYLYYSRDCSENIVDGIHTSQIYCIRLDKTLTNAVGVPILISSPDKPYELKSMSLEKPCLWNEGPTVIKCGKHYYMNYSANCYATNEYAICLSVADSPMGPFKKSVNNPVLSCRSDLFGAGHNAFFEGKDGGLYTSFHIQTDPEHPSGDRRTVIGRVSFSEKNGEIFQTIE
jgi:GH43 family beta-xylosidase